MKHRQRATACGKVILFGEHAVVYGVPALAAGIDRGARAEATLLSEADQPGLYSNSILSLAGATIVQDKQADIDIARAFTELLGDDAPPVAVTAESDIPPGGGLGSSAALAVAIARAVEALRAEDPDAHNLSPSDSERVLRRAMAWERVFHGNPSGIDTYAAAHGGAFRFARGAESVPIHPPVALSLCVGLSGESASTRTMVEGLARLFERKPDVKRRSLEAISALVRNAELAISDGDLPAIGKLMDLNHMILAGLFLSTEPLERLCTLARQAGAFGAKLTGSGGGGAVLALVPSPAPDAPEGSLSEVATSVLRSWRQEGFEGFFTRIAAR